ncbi:MAG: hypothetical protein AAFY72_01150 [Cyanobacteria bacterium J06649_4]
MENDTNNISPEESVSENVSKEQLEEVAGGNSIHKRRIEQLETHDSSKSVKDINIQALRLEELERRDSKK